MPKRHAATGGRYTRPRRGFRVHSHYKDRLRKRGLTNRDVKMESLYVLRKRQRGIPGPANRSGSAGRADIEIWEGETSIQVFPVMPDVASDELPGIWDDFRADEAME